MSSKNPSSYAFLNLVVNRIKSILPPNSPFPIEILTIIKQEINTKFPKHNQEQINNVFIKAYTLVETKLLKFYLPVTVIPTPSYITYVSNNIGDFWNELYDELHDEEYFQTVKDSLSRQPIK